MQLERKTVSIYPTKKKTWLTMVSRRRGAIRILGEELVGLLDGVGSKVVGRSVRDVVLPLVVWLTGMVWMAVHGW